MTKLKPIDTSSYTNIEDCFDCCYSVFKSDFMKKDARPKLKDREIYIRLNDNNWIEKKAEGFWHSSSLKPFITDIEILPCNNDFASGICHDNCINEHDLVIMSNGEKRCKCLYRSERVNFISKIVTLYNADDSRVQYWESKGKGKPNRIYLRYQEDEIDYMIVFEPKSNKRVTFISAFPVFFRSDQKKYSKEYLLYLSEK